eukprot:TRINITY_DN826_c0_g1_i10.p1 TRINITY_DN826_c0_g1~~TRINITY_DN826_c0_g1_i10.p1  ORF type:complete len:1275 (-),score=287.48 TRINITY_DN826_c0_g1_i10:1841-5665(-)
MVETSPLAVNWVRSFQTTFKILRERDTHLQNFNGNKNNQRSALKGSEPQEPQYEKKQCRQQPLPIVVDQKIPQNPEQQQREQRVEEQEIKEQIMGGIKVNDDKDESAFIEKKCEAQDVMIDATFMMKIQALAAMEEELPSKWDRFIREMIELSNGSHLNYGGGAVGSLKFLHRLDDFDVAMNLWMPFLMKQHRDVDFLCRMIGFCKLVESRDESDPCVSFQSNFFERFRPGNTETVHIHMGRLKKVLEKPERHDMDNELYINEGVSFLFESIIKPPSKEYPQQDYLYTHLFEVRRKFAGCGLNLLNIWKVNFIHLNLSDDYNILDEEVKGDVRSVARFLLRGIAVLLNCFPSENLEEAFVKVLAMDKNIGSFLAFPKHSLWQFVVFAANHLQLPQSNTALVLQSQIILKCLFKAIKQVLLAEFHKKQLCITENQRIFINRIYKKAWLKQQEKQRIVNNNHNKDWLEVEQTPKPEFDDGWRFVEFIGDMMNKLPLHSLSKVAKIKLREWYYGNNDLKKIYSHLNSIHACGHWTVWKAQMKIALETNKDMNDGLAPVMEDIIIQAVAFQFESKNSRPQDISLLRDQKPCLSGNMCCSGTILDMCSKVTTLNIFSGIFSGPDVVNNSSDTNPQCDGTDPENVCNPVSDANNIVTDSSNVESIDIDHSNGINSAVFESDGDHYPESEFPDVSEFLWNNRTDDISKTDSNPCSTWTIAVPIDIWPGLDKWQRKDLGKNVSVFTSCNNKFKQEWTDKNNIIVQIVLANSHFFLTIWNGNAVFVLNTQMPESCNGGQKFNSVGELSEEHKIIGLFCDPKEKYTFYMVDVHQQQDNVSCGPGSAILRNSVCSFVAKYGREQLIRQLKSGYFFLEENMFTDEVKLCSLRDNIEWSLRNNFPPEFPTSEVIPFDFIWENNTSEDVFEKFFKYWENNQLSARNNILKAMYESWIKSKKPLPLKNNVSCFDERISEISAKLCSIQQSMGQSLLELPKESSLDEIRSINGCLLKDPDQAYIRISCLLKDHELKGRNLLNQPMEQLKQFVVYKSLDQKKLLSLWKKEITEITRMRRFRDTFMNFGISIVSEEEGTPQGKTTSQSDSVEASLHEPQLESHKRKCPDDELQVNEHEQYQQQQPQQPQQQQQSNQVLQYQRQQNSSVSANVPPISLPSNGSGFIHPQQQLQQLHQLIKQQQLLIEQQQQTIQQLLISNTQHQQQSESNTGSQNSASRLNQRQQSFLKPAASPISLPGNGSRSKQPQQFLQQIHQSQIGAFEIYVHNFGRFK